MQAFRLSRIIKSWFNLVDLLKHEHALHNNLLKSQASRLKRHYFIVWLHKYLVKMKRHSRYDKLVQFKKVSFARRYFTPWLRLSRVRNTKRSLFFDMRARHLVSLAFRCLCLNIQNSTGERKRARKIILIRAERLIRTSFYKGLIAYCDINRTKRHKRAVAQRHKAG